MGVGKFSVSPFVCFFFNTFKHLERLASLMWRGFFSLKATFSVLKATFPVWTTTFPVLKATFSVLKATFPVWTTTLFWQSSFYKYNGYIIIF